VPVNIDVNLTDDQIKTLAGISATSWFTKFNFLNAESPTHPHKAFTISNDAKQEMTQDWIKDSVKGKRVLDLFSANGGFSTMAALAGAKEVVGVEFSQDRVDCANFIASTIKPLTDCKLSFIKGDVYELTSFLKEPFDVVLCLGGLYHIADIAYVLKQIESLTTERLIVQTSQIIPIPFNLAWFKVRREDKTSKGRTSIQGGSGTWHTSPSCMRELLLHGGFSVSDERLPSLTKRISRPWYVANCVPLN
jgi:tRNA (mo5U34)-methyltransferase